MNPDKTGEGVLPRSRYFRMSPGQRERIKQRQKERYRENPYVQRRRMYLRAVERGLIRCPKKLTEYDGPINNNLATAINGEEEEAAR